MRDISFSNPYLLLLFIPLALLIVLPFLFAVRKGNRGKNGVASVVLHILIVVCLVLGAAGTVITTVMTETNVYIVADVSYSANRDLDTVDAYIRSLSSSLPRNSKLGLVCFGKDQVLLTEMGGTLESVKSAEVDDSATNIAEALDYTAELFEEGVIKRIVLITDGKQTDSEGTADLIASIEGLYARNIKIDTIYIDSNIPEGVREVQISGVDYTPSTYLNHENDAQVLLESSYEGKALLHLYRNGEHTADYAVSLTQGYNVVNIPLSSAGEGVFDYIVEVEAEEDESHYNNSYGFTQTVSGKLKLLLITSSDKDVEAAEALFGESASIDSYVNTSKVPFTVEELCQYDEILLSNLDVRDLDNYTAFIESLDTVVSLFGKSLVTIGDTKIQNKTDDVLKQLEDMLPVRYGNSDSDPKLYCLVIDASRSMQNASHLIMAKQAAIAILDLLSDNDRVMVISFSGDVTIELRATDASEREMIAEVINSIPPTQGTYLGASLRAAYELMLPLDYVNKQVMLISDGMSYTAETENAVDVSLELARAGIITSAINTGSSEGSSMLQSIARAGLGNYFYLERPEDVEKLILTEVADDLTETVIEGTSAVQLNKKSDELLDGITDLGAVNGYVFSRAKNGATAVLTTVYTTPAGREVTAPIYAYWKYGNGRVAAFTSMMSGDWSELFMNAQGERFFANMLQTNAPKEKIDHPYTVEIVYDGTYSSLEILPVTLDPTVTAELSVTLPSGMTLEETLLFTANGYSSQFTTPELGKYAVHIAYTYEGTTYEATHYFHISYSPEYNSFESYDVSSLHEVIRNRGTVHSDADFSIENDEKEVATYKLDLTPVFLIAAIVLFVTDIIVRKIKWSDIRTLFKKKT